MRARASRPFALLLLVAGLGTLAWTLVTWQWRDPLTSLYTLWQQRQLEARYDELASGAQLAAARGRVEEKARRFRLRLRAGDPVGRLRMPDLGVDMVVVNGTDHDSLKSGPGRDSRSFMPGEGELVYLAGHRTTYLAPFADIDDLRAGDRVFLDVPYGAFAYEVTGHRIVESDDLSVLRSPGRETLRLQACHPRFFATHRYVVFAAPVGSVATLTRLEPPPR